MAVTKQEQSDPIGDRILQVATDQFVTKGVAGVTTAAVASAAKTSKRELYGRYPSKEALFEGVIFYLCSLGSKVGQVDFDEDAPLSDYLSTYCFAAARRFALPEVHAVLASAGAAGGRYAHMLDLFWNLGPGRATDAIAKRLRQATKEGEVNVRQPNQDARWLMMRACGPFTLEMYFSRNKLPSNARLRKHIAGVVGSYLDDVRTSPI